MYLARKISSFKANYLGLSSKICVLKFEPVECLLAFSKEFYFNICQGLAFNSQGNASNAIMISNPFHNPNQTRTEWVNLGPLQAFLISKVPESDVYPIDIRSTRIVYCLVFIKLNCK